MAIRGEMEPLLNNDEHHRPSVDDQASSTRAFSDGSTHTKDDYGDENSSEDDDDDEAEMKQKRKQRLKETGGWLGYLKDFHVFLPHLVPRNDMTVQLCLVVLVLCLAGRRVLNVLVPHQLGIIADNFLNHRPPYRDLFLWLGLSIINDSSGLGLVQDLALIPIRQFSARQITNAAFGHVLGLSMDFHSERDSAEVMKALEQGGALTKLLQTAVCECIPTVIDLVVALGVLYWKFDMYTSLIIVVAVGLFFCLEVFLSGWKVKPRRHFAKTERQEARVMHQAIQGWTTISQFNMFRYERQRFARALDAKLAAERQWEVMDESIEGAVELMLPITFFAVTVNAVYSISQGRSKPGDFVFLIQYWDYLIWPLKYLSHDYREIMSNLIDAERLLALFQTKATVVDSEGAQTIESVNGHVAFQHVEFAYHGRQATIRDISILAQPGETVALVGATGAGKSTIVKLLLRFYDVSGGHITIDGHDIRDMTLDSLRNMIGVVPQDPLLFNGTILDNLRYARPTASFADIVSACQTAAMHDRILGFPDGYKTRVGEQGVKLSGGEVQRLAVARVVLKDPCILILDEATSAIDTQTESNIQRALEAFRERRKRTTFVIAHRLSTIVRADQILVFDGGEIVERGSHEELLEKDGVYSVLWSKQTSSHD
ncbi:hypothetical protein ACEQ8H_007222 [Pleosporales sp. CAS-2024a]